MVFGIGVCINFSFQSQIFSELLEGAGAVAHGIFHGVAQFGEGSVKTIGNEEGIVTKAAGAGWLQADTAVAYTLEENGFRRLTKSPQRQDAAEAGGAVWQGHTGQEAKEFGVVGGVGGIARAAGVEGGETGGMDAGSAAQGVHFEAGVVGEDAEREEIRIKIKIMIRI
jgi:hypothetical protein